MTSYVQHFRHAGHAITVASGDSGFGPASFPAVLPAVTAVGGTELTRATDMRGWTEAAAPFSGSGCSAYLPKPGWQHDPHCGNRTVADVSAVADNLAVYATYMTGLPDGWIAVGGTSASTPIIASVYALAGNSATAGPQYPYVHRSALYDVISGTDDGHKGRACGHDYLCTAVKGYDAPTGLGTPHGTAGF